MKKLALLFLFLIPLTFAWQGIAMAAVGISAAMLGIIYMVGMGFGISELQMMAKEELFQLIAFGIMLTIFVGGNSILDAISTNDAFTQGATGDATTMQEAAESYLDKTIHDIRIYIFNKIATWDIQISQEASKASTCNVMNMGYSVSGCGGYTVLASPLALAGNIAGFTIGELSAMKRLLDLTQAYALILLLPIGIILRTVKFTRGAGGLIIALAIALHIMLPAGIIFTEMLVETFIASEQGEGYNVDMWSESADLILKCNAADAGNAGLGSVGHDNTDKAQETYDNLARTIRSYTVIILLRGIFGPIISLLMVITSIKAITSLAGAEIDVTAISRFV